MAFSVLAMCAGAWDCPGGQLHRFLAHQQYASKGCCLFDCLGLERK